MAPPSEPDIPAPTVDMAVLQLKQDAWTHDLILTIDDADLRDGLLGEPREFRDVLSDRRTTESVDDEILLDVIRLTLTAADESVGAGNPGAER